MLYMTQCKHIISVILISILILILNESIKYNDYETIGSKNNKFIIAIKLQ